MNSSLTATQVAAGTPEIGNKAIPKQVSDPMNILERDDVVIKGTENSLDRDLPSAIIANDDFTQ